MRYSDFIFLVCGCTFWNFSVCFCFHVIGLTAKSEEPLKSRDQKVPEVRVGTELLDILIFRRPCSYHKVPLLTYKLSFLISLSKSYKKY